MKFYVLFDVESGTASVNNNGVGFILWPEEVRHRNPFSPSQTWTKLVCSAGADLELILHVENG